MKCDELKPLMCAHEPNVRPMYDKSEVDKAIAELKAKLADKDKEIAELEKKLMPCLNGDCILTCEVIEKYGKENAELKQKLEDVQASMYADVKEGV